MINPDFSLFIQILNFLVLLFFLNILLFRPIRNVLLHRNKEMDSMQEAIADYQNRSDENEKGIEDSMISARKEGFEGKEKFRKEGLEQEKGILQQATSEVEEKIGNAKSEMESKVADVHRALEDQITGFSNDFAQKILGRNIQ